MKKPSPRKQAWKLIEEARDMWPPSLPKILQLYDEAEKILPDYYLIYKDRARLFAGLFLREDAIQEYQALIRIYEKEKPVLDVPTPFDNDIIQVNDIPESIRGKFSEKDLQKIIIGNNQVIGCSHQIKRLKSENNNPQTDNVYPFEAILSFLILNLSDYEGEDIMSEEFPGKEKETHSENFGDMINEFGGIFPFEFQNWKSFDLAIKTDPELRKIIKAGKNDPYLEKYFSNSIDKLKKFAEANPEIFAEDVEESKSQKKIDDLSVKDKRVKKVTCCDTPNHLEIMTKMAKENGDRKITIVKKELCLFCITEESIQAGDTKEERDAKFEWWSENTDYEEE